MLHQKNWSQSIDRHYLLHFITSLRNASTQLQKEWGYGKEYKYPHNYPDGWVEQDYLPAELVGRRFYQPRDMGDEARLSQWWRKIHKIRKTEES